MEIKITDGNLKKLEKVLLKTLKHMYQPDGMYCEIEKVVLESLDGTGFYTTIHIRYGRYIPDGKLNFCSQAVLDVADGNRKFLAGQFYQCILDNER